MEEQLMEAVEQQLLAASICGHRQIVEELIEAGVNPNVVNTEGWTAVMLCSRNGYAEVLQLLIDGRARVDIANADGQTAMVIASEHGHNDVAQLLASTQLLK